MTDQAHALWYTGPMAGEIRPVTLPPMGDDWVEVETLHSGLSRGTERLVASGAVPPEMAHVMRAPQQEGDFPFPVKYGYAAVGQVIKGPQTLLNRAVFALHPHQDRFRLPVQSVVEIPETVPPGRAILAANAETALNALWDANPRPGSQVLVVGLGMVGILIAMFLAARGDVSVVVTDIVEQRFTLLSDVNVTALRPSDLPGGFDQAFHCSANPAGLATALDALAVEGEVIELSWYGAKPVPVPLGGAFHARRLAIRCSQVGLVAPARRATTTHRDRLAAALRLLDDSRLDRLISTHIQFGHVPSALPQLLAPDAPGVAVRVDYRSERK